LNENGTRHEDFTQREEKDEIVRGGN